MPAPLRRACGVIAIVLTAGCATSAPSAQMTSPFNASDVAWSRTPGTATVEGRAAIPAGGGASRTCAGGEAQLLPAGAYAAEMMRIVFGNETRGYAPLASSPRYPTNIAADFKSTVRRIGCDPEGRFRFDGVPAGRCTSSPTSCGATSLARESPRAARSCSASTSPTGRGPTSC